MTYADMLAAEVVRVPAHVLARLAPGHGRVEDHGQRVREELRRSCYAQERRGQPAPDCWQEAWNRLVGTPTPGSRGHLRLPPGRCEECKGKRWSTRSYVRTGGRTPVCGSCHGTGHGGAVTLVAVHAEIPEAVVTRRTTPDTVPRSVLRAGPETTS